MSSLRAPLTKWPIQKPTHRTAQKQVNHQQATDI